MRLHDLCWIRRSFILLGGVSIVPSVVEAQTVAVSSGVLRSDSAYDGDAFASSMELRGDLLAVGATGAERLEGAVFIFERAGNDMLEREYLTASDSAVGDNFGASVALADGWLAVGAPNAAGASLNTGAVYVFEEVSGAFVERAKLFHADLIFEDGFGTSVAFHGDSVIVGCPGDDDLGINSGTVQVFAPQNGTYVRTEKFEGASTLSRFNFGHDLDVDGDRLVVGAPATLTSASYPGSVYEFEWNGSAWQETAEVLPTPLTAFLQFGFSVSLDGDQLAVGAVAEWPNFGVLAGSAYVFERVGPGNWSLENKFFSSFPVPYERFGYDVSIEAGRMIVTTQPQSMLAQTTPGRAEVFERGTNGNWTFVTELTRPAGAPVQDGYGTSIAMQECRVLVGAPFSSAATPWTTNAGAAMAYHLVPDSNQSFCHGDGGNGSGCTPCPCGNDAPSGSRGGCLNSASESARLSDCGGARVGDDRLHFVLRGGPPSSYALLRSGDSMTPSDPAHPCFGSGGGDVTGFSDGLRCIGGTLLAHGARSIDARGEVGARSMPWGAPSQSLVADSGFVVGQTRFFQAFVRDDPALICLSGQTTSNGVVVTFEP